MKVYCLTFDSNSWSNKNLPIENQNVVRYKYHNCDDSTNLKEIRLEFITKRNIHKVRSNRKSNRWPKVLTNGWWTFLENAKPADIISAFQIASDPSEVETFVLTAFVRMHWDVDLPCPFCGAVMQMTRLSLHVSNLRCRKDPDYPMKLQGILRPNWSMSHTKILEIENTLINSLSKAGKLKWVPVRARPQVSVATYGLVKAALDLYNMNPTIPLKDIIDTMLTKEPNT